MSRLAERSLQRSEEVVYLGVGLLLVASALLVLGNAAYRLVTDVDEGVREAIEAMLDALLITFILVELLSAVRATLEERTLVAEPFMLVGIIATIKELVVLAAFGADELEPERPRPRARHARRRAAGPVDLGLARAPQGARARGVRRRRRRAVGVVRLSRWRADDDDDRRARRHPRAGRRVLAARPCRRGLVGWVASDGLGTSPACARLLGLRLRHGRRRSGPTIAVRRRGRARRRAWSRWTSTSSSTSWSWWSCSRGEVVDVVDEPRRVGLVVVVRRRRRRGPIDTTSTIGDFAGTSRPDGRLGADDQRRPGRWSTARGAR